MGHKQGKFAGSLRVALTALVGASTVLASSVLPGGDSSSQKVLKPQGPESKRQLHGRFLHISDLHPDRFYRPGTSPDYACHVPKSSHNKYEVDSIPGSEMVGKYGAARSDCDSPIALANATFQWIQDTIKDGIDFVIWTGDSARHDNDVHRPRTNKEVWGLNKLMAEKMMEVFGDPNNIGDDDPDNDTIVPIVPTLGNNDMLPHNIMLPGPSDTIRNYLDIWQSFIPSSQYHVFARGGYYWNQVVPGTQPHGKTPGRGGLAVISLNTMYFFGSNAAVDGCDTEGEPGTLEMKWLGAQLDLMREEGMKAIIIGHVPPARVKDAVSDGWRKRNWDETCWRKYVVYQRQYRDVIVTGIFGHMNIDHFLLYDTKEAMHDREKNGMDIDNVVSDQSDVHVMEENYTLWSAADYLQSLRSAYSKIPTEKLDAIDKKKGKKGGKGGKKHDGLDHSLGERFTLSLVAPSVVPNYFPSLRVYTYNTTGVELPGDDESRYSTDSSDVEGNKKKHKKPHTPKEPLPPGPPEGTLPGPAYAPQAFSLMSYTQYFANITRANQKHSNFEYEVLYDTAHDKKGYRNLLKDGLFVKNYMKLAKALVDARKVKTKDESEISEEELEDEKDVESNDSIYVQSEEEAEDTSPIWKQKNRTKPKKGRSGGRIPPRDAIWEVFVSRAFVGSVEESDLQQI